MIEYSACSFKGNHKNQDRIMVDNTVLYEGYLEGEKKKDIIAVVCDGVGGVEGGEKAAETVALGFKEFNVSSASPYTVKKHLYDLNREILERQKKEHSNSRMATTVAGIVLHGNQYILFNLGDTRIYEVRGNMISLKSVDHNVKNDVDKVFALNNKMNPYALTCYLGGFGQACCPTINRGIISEDELYFIICSDGIYKTISDTSLKEIVLNRWRDSYTGQPIFRTQFVFRKKKE